MTRLPDFPDRVTAARLDWRADTPVASDFADVYFSVDGGSAEARFVFLDGNRLPERFAAGGFRRFVIGETGFGTGLNFLVAADEFLRRAPAAATLHFVSVEKFPLTGSDLARAHAHWPELAPLAAELQALYPPACAGCHHRVLAGGRIRLTLLFGDAVVLLPRLQASVDAWFLDGFAPAKNPELWTPAVFAEVARLSAPGATLATFTAATVAKVGLPAVGFALAKVPGFGHKRDMLVGTFGGNGRAGESRPEGAPTRAAPAGSAQGTRTAAVIGGGLAGCAAARALAERGWQVTLFERNARLADETSGNLAGAVYPKFSVHETAQNRWYRDSYLFAQARLAQVLGAADGARWAACGLLQLATGDAADKLLEAATCGRWPDTVLRHCRADETGRLTGIALAHGGLWFAGAAWVHPPALCAALVDHPGIRVCTGVAVQQLEHDGRRPVVDGNRFDVAVIANALAANRFAATAELPLRRVRGQVSHVAATPASAALRAIVCHEGYLTPARAGLHCVGATFSPRDPDPDVRASDHRENLDTLAAASHALYAALGGDAADVVDGRTGFRTQTPDYLPVIGPVAAADGAALPGLYVLAALGARGIAFSLLGAELIAAQANDEPLPVDVEVAAALDPGRFARRAQRRQRPARTERKPGRHDAV